METGRDSSVLDRALNTLPKIVRIDAERFPILKKIHDGFCPDPKHAVALLAMDEGKPVGRIFLVAPTHVEGPWIAPAWRSTTLGWRLMRAIAWQAEQLGVKKMFAYGTAETEDYLERLGYKKQPYTVWTKEI
jgi:hypothetical protein